MRKICAVLFAVSLVMTLASCGALKAPTSSELEASIPQSETTEEGTMNEKQIPNALGALSPEEALRYMKETDNLVIVDVATTGHYNAEHFEGAISIPIEELDQEAEDVLYMEIPADCPVLLHCRLGMVVPGAYERVLELRGDIPEIAYIDGAPMFSEYNEWRNSQ